METFFGHIFGWVARPLGAFEFPLNLHTYTEIISWCYTQSGPVYMYMKSDSFGTKNNFLFLGTF